MKYSLYFISPSCVNYNFRILISIIVFFFNFNLLHARAKSSSHNNDLIGILFSDFNVFLKLIQACFIVDPINNFY